MLFKSSQSKSDLPVSVWVIFNQVTVVVKGLRAVVIVFFTQMSVWSILAPLALALLPGSGWPSPGPVH